MIFLIAVVALTVFGVSTSTARSDGHPILDVAPLCHGITEQSDLQEGFRTQTFAECMKAEQEDRETMIKEWDSFSPNERIHCTAEAKVGGESSYTELLGCLEIAREDRALKKAAQSGKSAEVPSQKAMTSSGPRQDAQAQETVDVGKITCEQFLAKSTTDSRTISIWLSGYYSGTRNNTVVDVGSFQKDANKLIVYCNSHAEVTLMEALKNAVGAMAP